MQNFFNKENQHCRKKGISEPGRCGAASERPLEGVTEDLPWILSWYSRVTTWQGCRQGETAPSVLFLLKISRNSYIQFTNESEDSSLEAGLTHDKNSIL